MGEGILKPCEIGIVTVRRNFQLLMRLKLRWKICGIKMREAFHLNGLVRNFRKLMTTSRKIIEGLGMRT